MKLLLKALPYIALVGALIGAIWAVNHWDNGRLARAHDAGVAEERGRWENASGKAVAGALSAAQAATGASEAAGDTARSKNAAATVSTTAATQHTVDEVTHAYSTTPAPVCRPDGAPVPIPASVLDQLARARRAALGDP